MSIIITPQIRKTSELPFHSDKAPGARYVFVEKSLYPKSELYIIGRRVENVPQNQPEYIEPHRHKCNSFYVFIGDNEDLSGLQARVNLENNNFTIQSPSTVMIPAFTLHHYKLTKGTGWFFHINLRGNYIDSLVAEGLPIQKAQKKRLYKKAEKRLKRAGSSDRPLTSLSDTITNPTRWLLISPKQFKEAGIYSAIHQIFSDRPYQYEMKLHHHVSDEVYIILGKQNNPLEIVVNDGEKKTPVKSPATIYHAKDSNHKYEYIAGEGLILVVLKEYIVGEGYKFIPINRP